MLRLSIPTLLWVIFNYIVLIAIVTVVVVFIKKRITTKRN